MLEFRTSYADLMQSYGTLNQPFSLTAAVNEACCLSRAGAQPPTVGIDTSVLAPKGTGAVRGSGAVHCTSDVIKSIPDP